MSKRTAFERLIEKYADGRSICNCGKAYYKPCGHGFDREGRAQTNLLACEHGCSANMLSATEYIAERVEAELKGD